MDSAAERAVPDTLVAVAVFGVSALWLSSLSSPALGLQLAGLCAGALVAGAAVASLLRRIPRFSTPADRVTLARALLAALCAVLAVPQLLTGRPPDLLLVVLGGVAFLLDALDGPVARRTGTASAAGARFDAATDAALVLVLSTAAAGVVGPWTLVTGAMYYAFVAAGFFRPHLRAPLPPSAARKAIGAFQPFALLVALLPGIPVAAATAVAAAALALLTYSFGRDTFLLEQRRRTGPVESVRIRTDSP
ncbi:MULTISPECIES: CDP-alcohol phosphatidyltransferase family protein [unclassified Arthrobacter]|uniref:CDP-alcohol phosphatidyltransferase family protein n=1 Tax=unclassified Arthrobacter TaxID=235627 RepID=UPI001C85881F|nr:CDP-alcohol phosphatidyltransferase family protein [Arthrobacter sp. MAHUQ-56]MBX7444865.1 CDP-alcohol phosphatidyltransferase family protein [Arthrobacter sp. MAHUQ-56]